MRSDEEIGREGVPSVEEIEKMFQDAMRPTINFSEAAKRCATKAHDMMQRMAAPKPKPVATREAVRDFVMSHHDFINGNANCGDVVFAALSHFSTPACTAPIHGMTPEEIQIAMDEEAVDGDVFTCAHIAHRLAQPAPAVDPDAGAKRWAWLQYKTAQNTSGLTQGDLDPFRSENELWEHMPEPDRNGWRAVAAARGKGDE